MKICSNRFLSNLNEYDGKEINVTNYLDKFTMDSIFNAAFGIDIDCQNNIENLFLEKGLSHFRSIAQLESFHLMTR